MPDPCIPIRIDTREQAPWTFTEPDFFSNRGALLAGDYELCLDDTRIAIERKSLGDFVSTVIYDWLRFRKELTALSGYDCAAIVVEADLGQVFAHAYESEVNPLSIVGRAHSIFLEHGIPVFWWGQPGQANEMARRFFRLAWKKFS